MGRNAIPLSLLVSHKHQATDGMVVGTGQDHTRIMALQKLVSSMGHILQTQESAGQVPRHITAVRTSGTEKLIEALESPDPGSAAQSCEGPHGLWL